MVLILVLESAAFGYLHFLRYRNQNLSLTGFESKTGNIISSVLFIMIALLIIACFFFAKKISTASVSIMFILSCLGFAAVVISGLLLQKESKIISISAFLIATVLFLSIVSGLVLSRSHKLRFFKTLFTFMLLLVVPVAVTFILILNFGESDFSNSEKISGDAGVILGAAVWGGNRPSPVLKERINKGYELYEKKIVPKLVITGGGSPNELTEGEVSKNVLLKYGVAPENLIMENSSSSTVEQIQFVRDSLYRPLRWNKIILISDNFHLMRAFEICKFNNMNSGYASSDKVLSTGGTLNYCLKESLAMIIFWMSGV